MAETLTKRQRFAQLVWYYIAGPLLGFRQRLVVIDQPLGEPEIFTASLIVGFILAYVLWSHGMPLRRFAFVLTLLPVLVYIWSPVTQIVIEYRAYLSSFGMSLILVSALRNHIWALIVIQLIWIIQSSDRIRLYTSAELFWSQAERDCPVSDVVLAHLAATEDPHSQTVEPPTIEQQALQYKDSTVILVTDDMLPSNDELIRNSNSKGDFQ